jgi:hypothetical protein
LCDPTGTEVRVHVGVTGVRIVCGSLDLLKDLLEWFLDVDVTLLLSRKDVSPALVYNERLSAETEGSKTSHIHWVALVNIQ